MARTHSPRLLRQTTRSGRVDTPSRGLCAAIENNDFPLARLNLALGADPNLSACKLKGIGNRMTATALSVMTDSSEDGLFFLPWLLNRGGNIAEVDARGRTLLDHADSRVVALYLIENGAPVAEGMRDALIEAFRKPPGVGTFDNDVVLAARTDLGVEPWIFESVRKKTARHYTVQPPVWVPPARWNNSFGISMIEAMRGAGVGEADAVALARDPLFGAHGRLFPAAVQIDARHRLGDAMARGDAAATKAMLELGAYSPHRVMPSLDFHQWRFNRFGDGHTAVAYAAQLDSCFGSGMDRSEEAWFNRSPARSALHLLPLFEGIADLSGIHASRGRTLLHLDLSPVVVEWIVSRGAPYDAADADGNVPETVAMEGEDAWSVAAAALYARHRLEVAVPEAVSCPFVRRRL